MSTPTVQTILAGLQKSRIFETARRLDLQLPRSGTKAELAQRIAGTQRTLHQILPLLRRDELRAACTAHQLSDDARARAELIDLLISAAGATPIAEPPPRPADGLPRPNDLVVVRQRQYLVERVTPSSAPSNPSQPQSTRVALICLDDDAQGRPLEILWELELGARIIEPTQQRLAPSAIDAPDAFRAYLHALRWNCVTATDPGLFQAPFRAGIHIMHHQLTPLAKALALPRANLFIADDVGLGKTIEAGLIMQELILRQRVDTLLVVCPPSIALQWRDEMHARFGLLFEIYDRRFITRRRAERGFSVNPWATHNRFIISYQTLRRPEHLEPLLQHLGARAARSLLVLDEAHTVAPASASKYAVDSALTRVVRDLAPRFENRLFLSATPHNGHSNSFAALLEILDPQRFTRGMPVTEPKRLEPVMVRRLKTDLSPLGVTTFPTRIIQRWRLDHADGRWQLTCAHRRADTGTESTDAPIDLGEAKPNELILADTLTRYAALMEPVSGRARLVFVNLQKRLLSSVAAFHRTFEAHCARLESEPSPAAQIYLAEPGTDALEDATDDADTLQAATTALQDPSIEATQLRHTLRKISRGARLQPDARIRALIHWIQQHQCPGVALGGAHSAPLKQRAWGPRRLIIFTEYADTLRYLHQQLTNHLSGTDQAGERIMRFHGGINDDTRAEIRHAFNSTPADHPVRILLATDAAREGINLQSACADLLHFDIPWNPARLEQRNGRIDRTMQPEPEVRCAYFVYPQRPADTVLDTLVRKVDVIRRELGSVGTVVLDRIQATLADGIRAGTAQQLSDAAANQQAQHTAAAELETQRTKQRIQREIDDARKILKNSRKIIDFEPDTLREVIDIGLRFLDAPPLQAIEIQDDHQAPIPAWQLPALPNDWQRTLDTLRPERPRDLSPWEWRRQCPPRPVVFTPPPRLTSPVVHLHLEHPFVRRILSRFRAQGFAAHDLSRVSIITDPHHPDPMVVAIGRISLFGPGATRLHDELIYVGTRWLEDGAAQQPDPHDTETHPRLRRLLREPVRPVHPKTTQRLQPHAAQDFATLWPHVEAEAEARAHDAQLKLDARAHSEQAALRTILEDQRRGLEDRTRQTTLDLTQLSRAVIKQIEDDTQHMQHRLEQLDHEIAHEPAQLAELYHVKRTRVEPVGLVYLWPGA